MATPLDDDPRSGCNAPKFSKAPQSGADRSLRLTSIAFDRGKYGQSLLVDAAEIRALPNFITTQQPHRLDFYEIALVSMGRGALHLDGIEMQVRPFRVCCTRPGEIRRWRVNGTLNGLLVFFEPEFVEDFLPDPRFLAYSPLFSRDPRRASVHVGRAAFDRMSGIAGDMMDELSNLRVDSGDMLRAHTYRLLVELQRQQPQVGGAPPSQRHQLYDRFAALVDAEFRRHPQVAHYARLLRVSPCRLNECVRRASGSTASAIIHRRQFVEARRLLLYTDLTVTAIAARLGFSDAPYFNRFFKRMAGVTAGKFRAGGKSPAIALKSDLKSSSH
jgi:AraC-like DNA-binding protein